jgi:hypothetical protein
MKKRNLSVSVSDLVRRGADALRLTEYNIQKHHKLISKKKILPAQVTEPKISAIQAVESAIEVHRRVMTSPNRFTEARSLVSAKS